MEPHGDIEPNSPTSVRSEPTEVGPEPERSASIINQNDDSIHRSLSTQSKDSATSAEEKGALVGGSVLPDATSIQATENTETSAMEQNDANMPENETPLTQGNDSGTTASAEVGEIGELDRVTPKTDIEFQEKETDETDSMGKEYMSSPSPQKKRPQSGRRLSLSRGRRRTSSSSSYRRGSGPEGENLIKD